MRWIKKEFILWAVTFGGRGSMADREGGIHIAKRNRKDLFALHEKRDCNFMDEKSTNHRANAKVRGRKKGDRQESRRRSKGGR